MRAGRLVALAVFVVFAGTAFGVQRENPVIELTEEQVSIIVHNCPRDGEVTIDLTEDQISIIIHDYPEVEMEELTLGLEHLREDNTVELELAGRSTMVPVEAR